MKISGRTHRTWQVLEHLMLIAEIAKENTRASTTVWPIKSLENEEQTEIHPRGEKYRDYVDEFNKAATWLYENDR